ncbi:hypothetical protein KR50_09250 [Jeotgalibacillus campisalis]|uniref:Uncharacterized protein n=1 Tax=Jeotgalibacillus campisalis TaxID=220754 RepID=A0A0C2W4V7_9BACL|nr:hypothetical protein KR50_09250 [Jeotgalibacillus campisalis]
MISQKSAYCSFGLYVVTREAPLPFKTSSYYFKFEYEAQEPVIDRKNRLNLFVKPVFELIAL